MRRVLVLLVVSFSTPALAGERPCTQLLPADVSQRIEQLQGELEKALADDQVEAIKLKAAEIRKLHSTLPAGHWQRKSGENLAATFEKLASITGPERASFRAGLDFMLSADEAARAKKYAEAETALARAMTANQAIFPAPSHALAETYRKIAALLRESGKLPNARLYAESALEMQQQVWGEQHPWVARSHLLLADILDRSKEPELAEIHFRKGWEIARFCLGPTNDLAVGAKNLLQRQLVDRQRGRQADAVEKLHTLDELELLLGAQHSDTIATCKSVADSLEAMGDTASAEPFHVRVLAYQRANNAETDALVTTMNNLVMNRIRQNKTAEVEDLARKALEMQTGLGVDHPGTPGAWVVLGEALLAVQKVEPALEAFAKSLDLRRKILGEEHPGTVNAYNRLGNTLDDLGRHAEAEVQFRKSLEIGIKLTGEQNANVAALRCNLGSCLLNQGKLDEAEKCLTEATRVLMLIEGGAGVASAKAMASQAGVQVARQKYEDALAIYTRAHSAIKNTAGDAHPMLPWLYGNMATALQQLGRLDQAVALLEQSVALQRKMGGDDSPGCAEARLDLAECQRRRGKLEEAESLSREAVGLLSKQAPGTPELALAAVTLGRVLDAREKLPEGEKCHRQALALLQTKVLPAKRLVRAQAALGINLHRQNRDADAEPLLKQALAGMSQDAMTLALDRKETATALVEVLTALGKAEEANAVK